MGPSPGMTGAWNGSRERHQFPNDATKLFSAIRREGDHLSVQQSDEPKQELRPESEPECFSTASDDAYTFEMNAKGEVTGMTLHADGRDIAIKRIE